MAKKSLPCPTVLRQLLRYEPETGKLFWKKTPAWMSSAGTKSRDTQCMGKEAFTSCIDGYSRGKVLGVWTSAHAAAWAIQTGAWPAAFVDHKDGDRRNNKWSNLRAATHAENMRNTSSKGGTSRFLGVFRDSRSGKWRAKINVEGKQMHLGLFEKEDDAAKAYDAAAIEAFGEFANPNFGPH